MASKLPAEIWLGIVDGFDQNDLAAISLVSQTLHILVEPLLFSKYCWIPDIKYDFNWIPKRFRSDDFSLTEPPEDRRGGLGQGLEQPQPRVHLFLRSVLNRPYLASLVKSLQFMAPLTPSGDADECLPFWGSKTLPPQSGFSQVEMAAALSLVEDLKLVSRQEWRSGFRQGRCDVVLALLLSRLSEIESLEIRLRSFSEGPPMIGHMIYHVLSPKDNPRLPSFRALKSVSASVDHFDEDCASFPPDQMSYLYDFNRDVAPLFQLPYVEKLSLDWVEPITMPLRNQPVCSALTTLLLREGNISAEFLQKLLRSTPKLKTLEFDVLSRMYETRDGQDLIVSRPLSAKTLGSALNQVCSTLERLVVGFSTYGGNDSDDRLQENDFIAGKVGRMKQFGKLRHLEMPIHLLIRPGLSHRLEDVLPDQLKVIGLDLFPDPYRGETHDRVHKELKRYLSGHLHINNLRHEFHCSRCPEPENHIL
ncbi:hypothetical protein DL98DRAFT_531047 [Cadophora sp. DSE1049]|nr:hypothetical protein DL98DRAFT_531047 [Cadophora sp. DSE1049]